MGDIADILGLASKAPVDESAALLTDKVKKTTVAKKKPKGMSREVFDLVGSDSFVSVNQPNALVSSGFKSKRTSVLKGKWIWDSIKNSARNDKDQTTFYHWVKADVSYPDYPYAKFNIMLDDIVLSKELYDSLGPENSKWSFEDTLAVVETTHHYGQRWAVIHDRIQLSTPKRIEEIQARYYQVLALTTNNPFRFNIERETNRRMQQDLLFKKTKEDEVEELKLREELKGIDAALKKYKKLIKPTAPIPQSSTTIPVKAEPKAPSEVSSSTSQPIILTTLSNVPVVVDHTPMPGRPCLQSGRLYTSDAGLSKNLIKKVNAYLTQLNLPLRPAATRSVCDTLDAIRKDAATLMSLHSAISKREKDKMMNVLAGGVGGPANVTIKTEKKPSKQTNSSSGTGNPLGTTEPKPKKAATKRKSGVLDEKPTDTLVDSTTTIGGVTTSENIPVVACGNSSKAKKVCV